MAENMTVCSNSVGPGTSQLELKCPSNVPLLACLPAPSAFSQRVQWVITGCTDSVLAINSSVARASSALLIHQATGYSFNQTCDRTTILLVVGGVTRLTESGLSITEWRLITGVLLPLSQAEWESEFDKNRATPEFFLYAFVFFIPLG